MSGRRWGRLPDVMLAGLRNSNWRVCGGVSQSGRGALPGLPTILELPDTMDDLQLADLDLDGKLDVVGISANAGLLIVVLNGRPGATGTFDNTFRLVRRLGLRRGRWRWGNAGK